MGAVTGRGVAPLRRVLAQVFPVGNSREHLIDLLPRASVDGSVRILAATGPKQQSSYLSGSPEALLPRGPLRTGRATFTASGSSSPDGVKLTCWFRGRGDETPPGTLGVNETERGGFARWSGDPLAGHLLGDRALVPCGPSVEVTVGAEERRGAQRTQPVLGAQNAQRRARERWRLSPTAPGPVLGQGRVVR